VGSHLTVCVHASRLRSRCPNLGTGQHEIDLDTIRGTNNQTSHSCHSTQGCRFHPRSSRKWIPNTSGKVPRMTGMRSCCLRDQSGQLWITWRMIFVPAVNQAPKVAASKGRHLLRINNASKMVNRTRFTGLCASLISGARFVFWARDGPAMSNNSLNR
jgi:hypothetical protein